MLYRTVMQLSKSSKKKKKRFNYFVTHLVSFFHCCEHIEKLVYQRNRRVEQFGQKGKKDKACNDLFMCKNDCSGDP